jgi:hypothetical protein
MDTACRGDKFLYCRARKDYQTLVIFLEENNRHNLLINTSKYSLSLDSLSFFQVSCSVRLSLYATTINTKDLQVGYIPKIKMTLNSLPRST